MRTPKIRQLLKSCRIWIAKQEKLKKACAANLLWLIGNLAIHHYTQTDIWPH
jgi:hypothetical protein